MPNVSDEHSTTCDEPLLLKYICKSTVIDARETQASNQLSACLTSLSSFFVSL